MKRMLAIAGIMLASAGVVIDTPASADVHTITCSVESMVNARVAQLGTSVPWRMGDTKLGTFAVTYEDEVVVSRETPCDHDVVTTIVNHEWMHTQQHVKYGSGSSMRKVYGGSRGVERIADCGSQLLGSAYAPYLAEWGPCTTQELMAARDLIELPVNVHA